MECDKTDGRKGEVKKKNEEDSRVGRVGVVGHKPFVPAGREQSSDIIKLNESILSEAMR